MVCCWLDSYHAKHSRRLAAFMGAAVPELEHKFLNGAGDHGTGSNHAKRKGADKIASKPRLKNINSARLIALPRNRAQRRTLWPATQTRLSWITPSLSRVSQ